MVHAMFLATGAVGTGKDFKTVETGIENAMSSPEVFRMLDWNLLKLTARENIPRTARENMPSSCRYRACSKSGTPCNAKNAFRIKDTVDSADRKRSPLIRLPQFRYGGFLIRAFYAFMFGPQFSVYELLRNNKCKIKENSYMAKVQFSFQGHFLLKVDTFNVF